MTEKTIEWLVQEINDLLDISSVGLYEFMNLLNDRQEPTTEQEKVALGRRALERILAHGGVNLYWMQWPEFDHQGALSMADLPEDAFSPPAQHGRYVAVDRS